MYKGWEGGSRISKRENRKAAAGSKLASRAVHVGQEEENESSEGKGQDNERSGGPGLCNSLRKASGRTKNSGNIRREGSNMWVARLCGSTGRGIGRGPAGGRAPRAGLLTCLGCSGAESAMATAYKERGRSSAERGRMVWCGRDGRVGVAGQARQEARRSLVGTAPRVRCRGEREEGSGWTRAWLAPYLSGS